MKTHVLLAEAINKNKPSHSAWLIFSITINFDMKKKLNENVNLSWFCFYKMIVKKNLTCFNYSQILLKRKYIKTLKFNGVNVAPILFVYNSKRENVEIQRYIRPTANKKNNMYDILELLAKFHNVSHNIDINFNKSTYDMTFYLKGVKLSKLLLGFKEKYYTYPMKSLYESNMNNITMHTLGNLLQKIFTRFSKKFGYDDCIIHNDLTPNNIIESKSHKYYLIDFDFAYKSSIYVDFVDVILSRNHNIKDYIKIFHEEKDEILSYINKYNEKASFRKITYDGFVLMSGLKLLSYYLYIEIKLGFDNDKLKDVINFCERVLEFD